MHFRSNEVCVSAKTYWCLARIALAQRETISDLQTSVTADELAEKILSAWCAANHPELGSIFDERENLNKRAVEAAKKPL